MSYKDLSKGEQFIFDWQYKKLGPTSFKGHLAAAMAKADNDNLYQLFLGFPEEAEAMANFHHKKGWWDRVERMEGGPANLVIIGDHSPQTRVATTKEK